MLSTIQPILLNLIFSTCNRQPLPELHPHQIRQIIKAKLPAMGFLYGSFFSGPVKNITLKTK